MVVSVSVGYQSSVYLSYQYVSVFIYSGGDCQT